jgi:hypothetical protein
MIIRFQCVHDLSCVAGNGDALSSAAVLRTEEKPSRTCLRTIKGPNPIVPVSLQAGHRGHKWGGKGGSLAAFIFNHFLITSAPSAYCG